MTRKVTAAAARQGAARIPPPPAVAFGDPRGHGLLGPLAESQQRADGRPSPALRSLVTGLDASAVANTYLQFCHPGLLHVTSVIHR
jgi:hypothetical protein